ADQLRAKGFVKQADGSFAKPRLDERRNFAGLERISLAELPLEKKGASTPGEAGPRTAPPSLSNISVGTETGATASSKPGVEPIPPRQHYKNEKELQDQIANWLRLHDIWFSRSRMD